MDHFAMGVSRPDVLPRDGVDVVLELPEEVYISNALAAEVRRMVSKAESVDDSPPQGRDALSPFDVLLSIL
jgi:hypothetical protein